MYRSRVKCKLQVSMEIKTKRRVNTAQGKKRNESGVFKLKGNQIFSLHTTLEKFVKVKYTGHFEVVFEEIKRNWERTSCDYRDAIVFKASVFKVFTVHTKTRGRRFRIPPVRIASLKLKLRFRDGLV